MDNLLACLLPLPLMLVLFAMAMALAARLKSRRLKTEYGITQAQNRQLGSQNATYESTVTALQLEDKTLTDRSTSSANQNLALAQQVKLLTDENTDLRYNRDVAYERLQDAEAEFARRYLERQRLRWFALLAEPGNRCHSRSEIGARVFYPMLRFLGYGEEAFGADEPAQAAYAVYSVGEIIDNAPPLRLFMLQAVNPGIGITEAMVREADTDAYRAGAQKFVLTDADTFVLYRVGIDKRPVVRRPLVDLASYWTWIYAELAPSAFPP